MIAGWYPGVIEPYNGDFVREQVRLMRRDGAMVDLVYADLNVAYLGRGQYFNRTTIHIDENRNKDYICTGPFWPKNNSWGLSKWIRAFVRWVNGYIDKEGVPVVIHAHTYLGGIIAQQVGQANFVPYIVTEHFTGWMSGKISSQHKKLGLKALQGAKLVTAVSDALGQKLAQYMTRPVISIPNFVDDDLFSFSPCPTSPIFNLVIIGDLIPRKQVADAIRVVKELALKNVVAHLSIVGTGPLKEQLMNLSASLGIAQHISFLGQLSSLQVSLLIKQSHMLIHPSRLETFGIVVGESLCCGRPVIGYDNGGIQTMANLPGVYIAEGNDIGSLAQKALHVHASYRDLDLRQISESAHQMISARSVLHRIYELYRAVSMPGL